MKQKNHLKHLGSIMIITSLLTVAGQASTSDMGITINKAGQQRMLTQRMLKDYALIGMNNIFGDPKKDLEEMITLFDKNLNELSTQVQDKNSLNSLKEVSTLWQPIKQTLQEAPVKNRAISLQEDLENLLTATDRATGLIVKSSGTSLSTIVNTSGKQRMLSQRMSSLYMLKVWDIYDPKFDKKLADAIEDFGKAHEELLASKLNNDEIKALLQKSENAFMFFEMMGQSKSKKYIPSLINRSANTILTNMNKATELYAKQVKE